MSCDMAAEILKRCLRSFIPSQRNSPFHTVRPLCTQTGAASALLRCLLVRNIFTYLCTSDARFTSQADPQRAHQTVMNAAIHIDQLDGRAVAQSLGIAALCRMWLPDLFERALHPTVLRSRKFDTTDQQLLYHVDVACALHNSGADSLIPELPMDVRRHCRMAEQEAESQAMPLYASMSTRAVRAGYGTDVSYQFKIFSTELGPSRASAPVYVAQLAMPSKRVLLELQGEWNCIPGTQELSLATRLKHANLQQLGWRSHMVPSADWHEALDKLPLISGQDRVQQLIESQLHAARTDGSKP